MHGVTTSRFFLYLGLVLLSAALASTLLKIGDVRAQQSISNAVNQSKTASATNSDQKNSKMTAESPACNARFVEMAGTLLWVLTPATATSSKLPLYVFIVNHSDSELEVGESGYFIDCKLTLTGEDGRHLPCTKLGESLFTRKVIESQSQNAVRRLARGQCHYWCHDISTAFSSLLPGKYWLSLETQVMRQDIQSNQFTRKGTLLIERLPFRLSE